MGYCFTKKAEGSFEEVVKKVTGFLKEEGFGILTEIDVKETLKNKLGVDFRRYVILGACNPPFAYKALQVENKIGVLLPCNVIVQETPDNEIEVAAVDPVMSMKAVENQELLGVASQVREKLRRVVHRL